MSRIVSVPIGIGTVTYDSKGLEEKADSVRASALKKLGISSGGGAVLIG